MIEYYRDLKTDEVKPNQTVLCVNYVFWRENMLREEDKSPNVMAVMTGDWSGVYLENDYQRARFSPIRFILSDDNPRQTLEDYFNVTVELTQSHGEPVRAEQVEKVRYDAWILYKDKLRNDIEFLESLPKPPYNLLRHKKGLGEIF